MAKIRDESNAENDAALQREQRKSKILKSFGDREIGSGGTRTRADGVTVHGQDINDDRGWHTSR